jgi:hypothetical protein
MSNIVITIIIIDKTPLFGPCLPENILPGLSIKLDYLVVTILDFPFFFSLKSKVTRLVSNP